MHLVFESISLPVKSIGVVNKRDLITALGKASSKRGQFFVQLRNVGILGQFSGRNHLSQKDCDFGVKKDAAAGEAIGLRRRDGGEMGADLVKRDIRRVVAPVPDPDGA